MSKDWEAIAHCLRAELADYGGLLNVFEEQQRRSRGQEAEAVLSFATRVEAQAKMVAQSRARREKAVAAFAAEKGRPAASLRAMLSLIEPDARPLFKALITEVNVLLHRVRRACRMHHALLTRAVQAHDETLQHLRHQPARTAPPAGRAVTSHRR